MSSVFMNSRISEPAQSWWSLSQGQACFQRIAGFEERAKLYRFYHLCNHYVLFGGGYRGSAMSELTSLTRNMK